MNGQGKGIETVWYYFCLRIWCPETVVVYGNGREDFFFQRSRITFPFFTPETMRKVLKVQDKFIVHKVDGFETYLKVTFPDDDSGLWKSLNWSTFSNPLL